MTLYLVLPSPLTVWGLLGGSGTQFLDNFKQRSCRASRQSCEADRLCWVIRMVVAMVDLELTSPDESDLLHTNPTCRFAGSSYLSTVGILLS
jgi:hypothetical protein